PGFMHPGYAEREVCSREALCEQILEEAAQMRGWCLVAERTLARQKVLHERHDIPGIQRRQIEHLVAEAGIEKAIRKPEHVIDRAWAEAALPQKIGFEVAQQFLAFGLRGRKGWSCRHAYFNEMPNEQPGKIGNLDLALRGGGQPPPERDSKIWRQRRRRYALDFEQATEASKQVRVSGL